MLPKASKSLVVEEGMEVPDISHGLQSVVLPYPVQVSVVIWHSWFNRQKKKRERS